MVVLQWSSSIKRGVLTGVYLVMCGSTAEVFYVTWSTDRSISTLLWSSSIKEGALIGVYLLCCVWYDKNQKIGKNRCCVFDLI